jgi:hypothetical protein
MEHDLTEARKNARTDADAAAIAWAQDEIERLAKRPGRPRIEPEDGERVQLSFRVTPELKRLLDAAANASGRSQSQEAEMRLEKSFWLDQMNAAAMLKEAARNVCWYDCSDCDEDYREAVEHLRKLVK